MTRLVFVIMLVAGYMLADTKQPATPPSIDRIQKQAEAARDENRMDDAIKLYKRGVAIKPSWEEGWWSLGNIYYSTERFDEARDAFRRLAALQPDVGAPWAMLGLSEFEAKQYEQATGHLYRGTSLHKGISPEILQSANYHLALLLTRAEQYEASMKILALFAQQDLNDAKYVEAIGIAALRKPLLPSECLPTDRQLIMDTGRVMYDAAALKTAQAGAEFRILVDKYPETPNIHYLYGSFLLFADADGALTELKKELEISPSHVPAMVTISNEYLKRGDFKNALPFAQKAVDLDPQSFPAHTLLGRIYSEGNLDLDRGVRELEMARKIAPRSPEVRIALAGAYTKVGRKEEASRERQEFQKLRQQIDASASTSQ